MMKNRISTDFHQKRKTFMNATFRAPFSNQNRRNAVFHFWKQKNANEFIFRFWGAFGAQKAPERKSEPKSGKSAFGRFGLQKRAQNLTLSTVWRSVRKRYIFVKKLLFGKEKTKKTLLLA